MPIKLVPPRKGKTPNWSIRGTYLKIYVDKSCGTDRRSVARSQLNALRGQIERGEYPPREAPSDREQPTFLSAAIAYMEAGRPSRYVARLIKYFGDISLSEIDQAAIDAAAIALYPNVTAGTRNACVYTPTSAILHHAGIDIKIRRPKGAKGRVVTDWLREEDAGAIIMAADSFDRELALLLCFLLYTGLRLGEAIHLRWDDLHLEDGGAWIKRSKGGPAGMLRLRHDLADGLKSHHETRTIGRVFRFHQGGQLKHLLTRAKLKALGIPCPSRRPVGWRSPANRFEWVNFHTFRHTWATWMRIYGGADVQGLVATGNWRDARSAARYAHAVPRDEWGRVDLLPDIRKTGSLS